MKLSDRLHLLLLQAVKAAGSFDPKQNLHYVEEQMTLDEAKLAQDFLQWVTDNKRAFGHGTIRDVWRDWQIVQSGIGTKPKITKSLGHDECKVAAKFPSGGKFRLCISRSGEKMTLDRSSDPYLAQSQEQAIADWIKPLTLEETAGERVERIAAFIADCLSVDHFVRKIRNLTPEGA